MSVTYAKINIDNFLHNLSEIKRRTGRKICLASKADCYGHGAQILVKAAVDAGLVDAAGVADVSEGIELREAGIQIPMIIFRGCLYEDFPLLVKYDIQPFVSEICYAEALDKCAAEAGKELGVHLKVDSGMCRAGCCPENALELARFISKCRNLRLEGMCTHFAVADSYEPVEVEDTKKQIAVFDTCVRQVKKAGICVNAVHCAASGAILAYPETYYDMVRPGIIAYGYPPSREFAGLMNLKPVMDFVSHIILVKKITKGSKVSYGFKWIAERDTTIAIVGSGYADGYNRLLSGSGHVSINKVIYPVIGRVCMDQFMIDLGDNPAGVKHGDEAVLFGAENSAVDAMDAADLCNTISYELLCNVNKRVPRVYFKNGKAL